MRIPVFIITLFVVFALVCVWYACAPRRHVQNAETHTGYTQVAQYKMAMLTKLTRDLMYVLKKQHFDEEITPRVINSMRGNNEATRAAIDNKVRFLINNYNPTGISEVTRGADGSTSTTYNKGEAMDMCIRDITGKIHDDGMLVFVFIHELAHMMTYEPQHTDTFWANFKFLLEVAVHAGLYVPKDFAKTPEHFCGELVKHSPLYDAAIPSLFSAYVREVGGQYSKKYVHMPPVY